ncbi:photosystem reaction center subunit H [Tersicoccus solisilvae]|uniref:Photosystem reaction center subunit H n=1 Tax=Tersicoccus solisilvae TaxID=1882339 RepID=A0ABQ1P6P7_9MICC|nr:PRC and DUF2382 domain-containing protein [Tersicoccus solisilvae]GGC91185.1 photosystem reaction center subunit H [Tersicoccus solisilvae]
MAIDKTAVASLFGADVRTADDSRLGSVEQVYLDDQSGAPEWVTVRTGLFGTKETFVPIRNADLDDRVLRVPWEKDVVTGAPRVDAEQGHLSPEEETELFRYYGVEDGSVDRGDAAGRDHDRDDDRHLAGGVAGDGDAAGTVGHDTSGPTTDEAMTRSEERLRVGKESVETGRARLRKYIVTEQQTVQVPVSHEEVTIEREPITDANRAAAQDGPELSEEEHEVVLHAERPVVEKDVEAVERVRLGKQVVQDDTTVTEQVRKEVIETDTDGVAGTER